jgi:hypothetical protein
LLTPRQASTDGLAVTKAENVYDYAGQDPINSYDLDGLMLDAGRAGDCDWGSCGNTYDTNPTGVASIGTIANRIVGQPVKEVFTSGES